MLMLLRLNIKPKIQKKEKRKKHLGGIVKPFDLIFSLFFRKERQQFKVINYLEMFRFDHFHGYYFLVEVKPNTHWVYS